MFCLLLAQVIENEHVRFDPESDPNFQWNNPTFKAPLMPINRGTSPAFQKSTTWGLEKSVENPAPSPSNHLTKSVRQFIKAVPSLTRGFVSFMVWVNAPSR